MASPNSRHRNSRASFSLLFVALPIHPCLPFDINDYPQVRLVESFDELLNTPFAGDVNALCWPRQLAGDFAAVVNAMAASSKREGIISLSDDQLRHLASTLGESGRLATRQMLEDLERLRGHDLDPVLDYINASIFDANPGPVPTDVSSFHIDSATAPADTWLCTYHGAWSEGLSNRDAIRRVDVPSTRASLLREFGGADDEAFEEHLREQCYALHFEPRPGSVPFGFGLGNLWRIAVAWPGSPVLPCIHRAPFTRFGDPPRLLLIS